MSTVRPIREVANDLDLDPTRLVEYGQWMAKIEPDGNKPRRGRLVLVSAITPTPAGEGKTTTSIGLAQGMAKIGESVCLALREPSLGPIFGVKGGGTGGGAAVLHPSVDINLHFTGDFHAITAAHNLLAAMLDNHLHQGNKLGIDPRRVLWPRVLDVNDRALRHVMVGLAGPTHGVPREGSFDITAASEIMAALCLAEDAEDMRARLSRLLVAMTYDRQPITAADLEAVGPMLVLLKDALKPNLVQAREGVPAVVHGGPFANIAHGCNSVIATKTALTLADWVITEAGFGFDLGAEKFYDIKCNSAGLTTAAVVLVATCRALKMHGGRKVKELEEADPGAVERGLPNLHKHIESIRIFGQTPIVALNLFPSDSKEEIEVVRNACEELGVPFACSGVFADGGDGGKELARTLVEHAEKEPQPFTPLYDWKEPIRDKLEKIATKVYGAKNVAYTRQAERDIKLINRLGFGELPLCVAKTQSSLSDDPKLPGRPEDFYVSARGFVPAAGAGFVVALLGDIMRMPGLPKSPAALGIDLVDGKVQGVED